MQQHTLALNVCVLYMNILLLLHTQWMMQWVTEPKSTLS